jgi:hypothetical protein
MTAGKLPDRESALRAGDLSRQILSESGNIQLFAGTDNSGIAEHQVSPFEEHYPKDTPKLYKNGKSVEAMKDAVESLGRHRWLRPEFLEGHVFCDETLQ